jgi:hypothetical protein
VAVTRWIAVAASVLSLGTLFVAPPDAPMKVAALGWDRCGAAFGKLWRGGSADGLDFYPVLPTADTWADGDRALMCVVYRPSGKLPGSVLPLAN